MNSTKLQSLAVSVAVISFIVVVAASAITPAGGAADSPASLETRDSLGSVAKNVQSDEECRPPLSQRERAKQLHSDLVELDSSVVSDDAVSDVNARIERGDTSLNLDRHCDAKEAYESAIAIAEPALRRSYGEATRHTLDEIEGMLEAEATDGNPDPDVGRFRERADRLREDLNNSSALQEQRQLYQRAEQLRADTQSNLPTTPSEQLLEAFIESPFITGIAAVLAGVVGIEAYLLIDTYRADDDVPSFTSRGGQP